MKSKQPPSVPIPTADEAKKTIRQGLVVNVYVLGDAHVDIACIVCLLLLLLLLIGLHCQEQVG